MLILSIGMLLNYNANYYVDFLNCYKFDLFIDHFSEQLKDMIENRLDNTDK